MMREHKLQRHGKTGPPRLRAGWIAAVVLMAAVAAGAQEPFPTEEENLGRGFDLDVDKTFLQGEFDQVNLFNGNLTLTVPIGGRYPLGPDFTYGLTLVYNSNLWDSRETSCSISGKCGCCMNDENCTNRAREVWPQLDSNAGLGWKLSLGDLYEPSTADPGTKLEVNNLVRWVYLSPDGGRHAFYEKLHHEVSTQDAGILYTNDGSYLRLLQPATGTRVVQFRDGTEHEFEKDPFSEQRWRLVRMEDRYGNYLTVTYSATDAMGEWTWTLEDSHGRTHVVTFETDDSGQQPADITSRRGRVKTVDLAAFGGAGAPYTFVYDPFLLKRGCGDKHIDTPEGVGVPFLQRVDFPEGLSFAFSYDRRMPSDLIACPEDQPGLVSAMTLPTGGSVEWTYGRRSFPASKPCTQGETTPLNPGGCTAPPPVPHTLTAGVATRILKDEKGEVVGAWTYDSRLDDGITAQCQFNGKQLLVNTFVTTTVTNPLGERSEHYFSVFQQKDQGSFDDIFTTDGWSAKEYGLPFRRDERLANENVFLSSRTFRASRPSQPNECTNDPASCLVQSTWVRYEQDPPPPRNSDCATGGDSCSDTNPRQVKELTGFSTASGDSGTRIITTSSGFDGLGNFRSRHEEGKGNFTLGILERTVFRDYNPGQRYTPGSPQMSLPDATGDWLWNLPEREVITHGSGDAAEKAETRFCYGASGFLTHVRVLADPPGLDGTDLLTRRFAGSDGRVTEERLFGGDLQDVPKSGGFCGSAPGLTPQSIITHQYTAGVRSKSTVLDGSRRPVINRLDRDIDASGLPREERDAAGVATAFGYDLLGRPTFRQTGTEAATVIEYLPFQSATTPAQVVIERRDAGNNALTFGHLTFDGLGRVVREEADYPGDTSGSLKRAVREATYDPLGRMLTLSEWGQGAPGSLRTFSRDYAGRVTRVGRPDGTEVTFDYAGVRRVSRTVRINGTAPCSEAGQPGTCSTISAELDPFGRVVRVSEPSAPGGALVHTDYAYDEGDRLTAVDVNAGGTGAVQERRFDYDPRGLLTCESHPELGATTGSPCAAGVAAGTVRYSDYDALGNATRVDRAGVSLLRNVFDAAGRLVQVWDQDRNLADGDDGSLLLEELFYARCPDPSSCDTDRRRGKLVYAKRHHALPQGPRTIGERFVYADAGAGRLTEAQLRSSFGRRFFTVYEHDQLGNVDFIQYPVCADSGCSPVFSDPIGVELGWEQNQPTGVRQVDAGGAAVTLASRLTRHPSGLLHEVRHGNGVTDTYTLDPSGMDRLGSIALGTLWNLGGLTYDAAGNITGFGTHAYSYDPVGRFLLDKVGSSDRQAATYDRFGNLTGLTTEGNTTAVPASSETNRLGFPSTVLYDGLGRVTGGFFNLDSIVWDPLDRPIEQSAPDRQFLYDASGNRVAILQPEQGTTERTEFWSVRGADGEVLRDFLRVPGGAVERRKDYYRRGSQLLASALADGSLRHYHLDHLGSTRLITDAGGAETARFEFHPFGQEAFASGPEASGERFRFTGHERDTNCNGCAMPENDDLDYMLARYYSPVVGRFLSPDEVGGSPANPQSWNRYAYSFNNPVRLIDPDGRAPEDSKDVVLTQAALAAATVSFVESVVVGSVIGTTAGVVAVPIAIYYADEALGAQTGDPRAFEKTVVIPSLDPGPRIAAAFLMTQFENYLMSTGGQDFTKSGFEMLLDDLTHEKRSLERLMKTADVGEASPDGYTPPNPAIQERYRARLEPKIRALEKRIEQVKQAREKLNRRTPADNRCVPLRKDGCVP